MKKIKLALLGLVSLVMLGCQSTGGVKTTDPDMPANAYLDGKASKVGVVLCHGRGQHPTWDVVDPLRKGIHEKLGYHTLSIQMPTGSANWMMYANYFPDAHKRIAAAVRYLKQQKGVEKVYLMGHSMGSRMATSYLAENPDSGIAGFIGVGVRNGGGQPLDSAANLDQMKKIPVIDVYGDGGDGVDARHAEDREFMVSDIYKQALIPGADHRFHGHENAMVNAVVTWLGQQK